MFLMLTLYMQQVLGYSPMKTGVAYLAVAGSAIVWSTVAAQLVNRVGVKPVIVAGMAFLTAGLLYFTQVSVGGAYVGDLLPGFLLIAVGLGFSFVPISIAALAGVQSSEAGLASGLFNTSQQIGGALGIAALSAIATTKTENGVASGTAVPQALTDGFQAAFIWGGIIAGARDPHLACARPAERPRGSGRGGARAAARGRLEASPTRLQAGPSTH